MTVSPELNAIPPSSPDQRVVVATEVAGHIPGSVPGETGLVSTPNVEPSISFADRLSRIADGYHSVVERVHSWSAEHPNLAGVVERIGVSTIETATTVATQRAANRFGREVPEATTEALNKGASKVFKTFIGLGDTTLRAA
jgi:hypothetical protein